MELFQTQSVQYTEGIRPPFGGDEAKELVRRVKRGDRRAFWDLMRLYEQMIYRFCYRKVSIKELAEDIARDTFLKAFDKIRDLKDDGSFKSWLFTIARNMCVDELRRMNKLVEIPEDDDPDTIPDGEESPEMNLEEKEAGEIEKVVMEAVNKLPHQQRDLVLLVHYEGMSYEGAARVLNIPVGTVRSSLSRGMKKLKMRLEGIRE